MNQRIALTVVLGLALSTASLAFAQDANPATPSGQNQGSGGPGNGGGGQRRGMGGGMAGGMGAGLAGGRGVTGTVTEAAADHFTVKTLTGEAYAVQFSSNTRFIKQMVRPEGAGQGGNGGNGQGGNGQGGNGQGGNGQGGWQRGQRNGQYAGQGSDQGTGQGNGQGRGFGGGGGGQPIKATDIKVGDAIAAMGQPDESAKSIGAVGIVLLDPGRAKQMQQMQENYGKTWIMGKVTAINDVQVTLQGSLDNAPHTFAADENTSFRQRNNPVTLADIHVGDMVRAEGAVKDGLFTATTVNVMGMPADSTRVPRNGPAPQ